MHGYDANPRFKSFIIIAVISEGGGNEGAWESSVLGGGAIHYCF